MVFFKKNLSLQVERLVSFIMMVALLQQLRVKHKVNNKDPNQVYRGAYLRGQSSNKDASKNVSYLAIGETPLYMAPLF